MGSDLTVVNSARVSFGTTKSELDKRDQETYQATLFPTSTLLLWSIVLLPINLLCLFTSVLSITATEHGVITKLVRRYTDKELRFYCPREFRTQHKSNRQASNAEELIDPHLWHEARVQSWFVLFIHQHQRYYREHCQSSLRLFDELVNKGVCREQARGVLPQTLYTEYYGTVNLNNFLNLFLFVYMMVLNGRYKKSQKHVLEIASDLFPCHSQSLQKCNWSGKVSKGVIWLH